jgi:peptidoglycan/xylan/chitin deacetylase (PgdA/CDA1 family)
MSLMLHSWFGVKNTEFLAKELIANGLVTNTYSQVHRLYDEGKCVPKNVVLVSLDDFYSVHDNKILFDMAEVFLDYGLVMTIALVTRDESYKQNLDTWSKLIRLHNNGFEIASHSSNHHNPYELNSEGLEMELRGSHSIICRYLGKCPETYILPYGIAYDYEPLLFFAKGTYRSIVSIKGPNSYFGDLFVMRRMSPGDYAISDVIELLEKTFVWFPSCSAPTYTVGKKHNVKAGLIAVAR